MRRFGHIPAGLVLVAALAGCANKARPSEELDTNAAARLGGWSAGGDPGLEVIAWSTEADLPTFARALAPYAARESASGLGGAGGLSPESVAFLQSHGLYLLEVPVADLEQLRVSLGAPPRHVNQWLGQAVVWTEAVSGPDQPRGQTIALDAERLRLGPGRLRLLARAWISPAPGSPGASPRTGADGGAGGGVMTIELLPQHDEEGRPRSREALLAPASIASTDEGMLFTRLLVRLAARSSDKAFVLVGLPSRSDITELAKAVPQTGELRAITDGEAGAAPGVGQVVRQAPGGGPSVAYETGAGGAESSAPTIGPVGPPAAQLPTLGEAMLSPPVWVTPRRTEQGPAAADARPVQTTPRRLVAVFLPRVPERVNLLP